MKEALRIGVRNTKNLCKNIFLKMTTPQISQLFEYFSLFGSKLQPCKNGNEKIYTTSKYFCQLKRFVLLCVSIINEHEHALV